MQVRGRSTRHAVVLSAESQNSEFRMRLKRFFKKRTNCPIAPYVYDSAIFYDIGLQEPNL